MILLSIIIPCFNESKSLPILVKNFANKLKRNDIELIIIDNGSKDSTNKILSNLKKKYVFLKSIKIKNNIGYGNGILQGLKKAKGEYLSWTHADLQTDPYDVILGFENNSSEKYHEYITSDTKVLNLIFPIYSTMNKVKSINLHKTPVQGNNFVTNYQI